MCDVQKLPFGTQSFSSLRNNQQIYVDKSEQIYELARVRQKVFLARPRRFGKSLLLSTFESLFAHGLRDFKGLVIEKLWQDHQYETVRLDFSAFIDYQTVDDFRLKFYSMLGILLGEHGFAWDGNVVTFSYQLAKWLRDQPNNSLVLLIDEYDAPLTRTLNDRELFLGIQKILSEFFYILKSEEGCLRFLFITGITRFSNTSIFSGFNNLRDISQEPTYGALLGYTETELKGYFGDYLRYAATQLNISQSVLLERLREYYDGFTFDSQAQKHVYCPWSVLNFFQKKLFDFANYWFTSGGQPSVLMNYLAKRKLDKPLDFLQTIVMSSDALFSSAPYDKLDVNVLLHQTGYLTIRAVNAAGDFILGYPNREVEASMAQLYTRMMISDDNFRAGDILGYMFEGEVSKTIGFMNRIFNVLDYDRYPIRDEASFRGAVQILMIGLSLRPAVEVHTSRGRSDIEVDTGNFHWVFELKFAKATEDTKSLCQAALKQIQEKAYGQTLHGKTLIRVGVVFSESKRQITDWQQV